MSASLQHNTMRRITSLDGLRTLAIASIVCYHLGVRWLPSEHMGVVIFLTLTGYLLASSVVREFGRTVARPSLFVSVAGVVALIALIVIMAAVPAESAFFIAAAWCLSRCLHWC